MYYLLFEQTDKFSYRDPAAFIKDGVIYLFFTLVENADDGQYFYVAESKSADFIHWSEPVILTEKDKSKNYSSPENGIGLLKTKDFNHFENCGVTTLKQKEWNWAKVRVTAGFVLELPVGYKYRYALFFHGDNEEKHLFGASLTVLFFNSVDTLITY